MTTNDCTSKLVVSVDVEDWYHGPTVLSPKDPARSLDRFLAAHPDAERGFRYVEACLEMLAAQGIRATFFWVAEYARRHPDMLRRVVQAGHEIACHGLEHYAKLDPDTKREFFTRTEFIERTRAARRILQDLSGQPVTGYRAPNAYISGAMLDGLEEAGFAYDSSVSVNSLYNKTNSTLAGVTTRPYRPARGDLCAGTETRAIVEFPWPYYEFLGFKLQTAGGPFLRLLGSTVIIRGLDQSLRRGHTIFYFHPIDICNEDIPFQFSARRPLLWAVKGDRVRRRIERVLQRFRTRAIAFDRLLRAGDVCAAGSPAVPTDAGAHAEPPGGRDIA